MLLEVQVGSQKCNPGQAKTSQRCCANDARYLIKKGKVSKSHKNGIKHEFFQAETFFLGVSKNGRKKFVV